MRLDRNIANYIAALFKVSCRLGLHGRNVFRETTTRISAQRYVWFSGCLPSNSSGILKPILPEVVGYRNHFRVPVTIASLRASLPCILRAVYR